MPDPSYTPQAEEGQHVAVIVPSEGRPYRPTTSTDLVSTDGNAFMVIGHTQALLRRAGASPDYIAAMRTEAMSGDYDHVITTCMAYLDAEPGTEVRPVHPVGALIAGKAVR